VLTQLPSAAFGPPRPVSVSHGGAIAAILVALAAGCAQEGAREDEQDSAELQTADSIYPRSDEGLGAAIAIVIDNSGSMEESAAGDPRPKYVVAREAIEAMLEATDSLAATRADFPIMITIFSFATRATRVLGIQPYNRDSVRAALDRIEPPRGGTAIGSAMAVARRELYAGGVLRKYLLVVTDGENTDGRSPAKVAEEISTKSERSVQMYFVAFDTDAAKFDFLKPLGGDVLPAANAVALRETLGTLYTQRIWAEAGGEVEAVDSVKRE
jgi:Mg-chelatase subunit ChlD